MTHRKERLNSLIREELSKIIVKELEFDGALVTITEVETSDDFDAAIINVSILPVEKDKAVLKILESKAGQLQYLLIKKLKMRSCPRIKFKIDAGLANAAKIEKILIDEENMRK